MDNLTITINKPGIMNTRIRTPLPSNWRIPFLFKGTIVEIDNVLAHRAKPTNVEESLSCRPHSINITQLIKKKITTTKKPFGNLKYNSKLFMGQKRKQRENRKYLEPTITII